MKKISSTIMIFFALLLLGVLGFTTIWNFSLLKSDSKEQTLQFQMMQTESIGKPLLAQINGVRSLITDGHLQSEDLNTRKNLGIEQSFSLMKMDTHWQIDSVPVIDNSLLRLITKFTSSGVKLYPYPTGDQHLLVLASLGPSEGALVVLNISQTFRDCEGQGIGIINDTGDLLVSCDQALNKNSFSSKNVSIKKIRDSKFSAGSFESAGDITTPDAQLFSYYQPNSILSVIGVVPSKVAFRPAYFMSLRMVLLILCGFGIAILCSVFLARRVTGPIELVINATERVSNGEFDFPLEVKTKNELNTLANAVKRMAGRIKELVHSEVEKAKIDQQLAVAGELQRTLLPPNKVQLDGFQMESLYIPADQCGGDWWSYIECGNKLIVLIGDVTGHGYPSALLVAAVRGGIALVEAALERGTDDDCDPGKILTTLNRVVYDSAQAQLSMTAQCLVIDRDSGEYKIASAGHPSAFFMRTGEGTMHSINLSGVRLGEVRDMTETLDQATGVLDYNEKMVLYTDGLQELGNTEKQLDKKGVVKFFKTMTQNSPEVITQKVQDELLPLNEGLPLRDDITLVVLERAAHA